MNEQIRPRATCHLCGKPLDDPNDPTSLDCGGDCLACMAEAGDPDAIKHMEELNGHGRNQADA
jgi:hypothetical protein